MNLFEGKSPTERNKIIAAGVLGVLSLAALFFAFGGSIFSSGSSSAKISVKASPTPRLSASPGSEDTGMPSVADQNFVYTTVPVAYDPRSHSAPDPGRNIFAFYEPPPPCPDCPTPTPPPVIIPPPTPTPPPPMLMAFVMPQSVYAGSSNFRLEVNGDRFDPTARIYFSQSELPTTFVSAQKLIAEVPANLIVGEGSRQIIVQTPDGTKYSNQVMLNVQAPPKPQFQYIGMIARLHYNNDTAYFLEQGKPTPTSARLNDIVNGGNARFRLISISAAETVLEDVNLGFKHKLELYRPPPGTVISNPPVRGMGRGSESYIPYNPNPNSNTNTAVPQSIPGIPDNIPRHVPPAQERKPRPDEKQDVDDDDPGDGR